MQLFDVVPEGLFQLLTGINKRLYAEALLLLYEYVQTERFGIRYEVVRDLLQEMLETRQELGEAIDSLSDDDDELAPSDPTQLSMEDAARIQANMMLRRLERLEWIDVEVRAQFERFIVLPHYASRFIGVIKELCEDRTVEYQRFAFLINQSLTGDGAKLQPYSAVLGAADVSRQFRQELTVLYNNMKHHMEQIVQQKSIKEVLDHHFDHYKSQIIDKSYHRLKTSDHVARYRIDILNTVQTWLLDAEKLQETALDGLKSGLHKTQEEALKTVKEGLIFIGETFSGLEEIFYQIDVRHNQYLRSSYDRARYLSQQNEGMDQQLAMILEQLSSGYPTDGLGNLFSLWQLRSLSEQSLLPSRRKRAPHQPEVHVKTELPEAVLAELRTKNIERICSAITRQKIEAYVFSQMGDRTSMELEELVPQSAEQLIMLGYVYLYGEVKNEGWRNALEGYLNTQRFDLLVEPEWFAEALRIYEREKWNHQLEGVGLVDTEKERRYLNSSEKGSLALELQVDHPVILAHAEHLLGKVMKAANEQELRKYRTAVTQSGMVYHNLTARQIPKKQYEVPYLGSKAIERQLEIFRAELKEALEQQGQLQRLSDQFRYFIKITDEKQSKYRTFTSNLSWMRTRRELLLALEEDRLELGNLDLKKAEQLKADYEFWSQSEQSWNQKLGELQKAVGKSEEELRHLEEKILLQAQRVKEESTRVSQWVEEYGAQSEERALLRYADAQRQTISVSQKLQNWRSSWERQQTLRENQWKQLSQLRQTYNYQHGFAGDANDEGNQSYDQLLEKIESLDIPDYQEKVLVALKESEEEFKSHFIFKLREAIEMARRELNHALRHFPFSNDSYHFDVTPHDRYKKFYDALMDPMLMEKGSLFDLPDNDRTAVLHELFEMLVRGEAGQLEEFTDYRQYLDFDIMVTAENGGRTRFSQVLKEKSGGETQTPFYIAILAYFHHLYSEKSSRLVVFDEAFNKMDEERIQSSLRLIKDMRLQLIAAVPDEKMQYMAPEMTTTLFVSKHDYHCYVDMIDRLYDSDEAMAEVAAGVA